MRVRILFLLKREITNWFPLQIATDDNLNSSASIPLLYPDCLLCLKIITLLYKNIFYKNIEAEIYEILRINPRLRLWKGYNLCWKSVNTIQFSMVVAHDLSEYRYMDDVTWNLFSLFCSTWRAVLKMFVRFSFGLKQVKSSKNVQQELFTVQKNGETGTKRALDYFRMPKLQEIFTTAAIVFHRYEIFAVLQNVFAIILLWARKVVEKLFEETVYN